MKYDKRLLVYKVEKKEDNKLAFNKKNLNLSPELWLFWYLFFWGLLFLVLVFV